MRRPASSTLPAPLLDALSAAADGAEPATRAVNAWAAQQSGRPRREVEDLLDVVADLLAERCPAPVRRVGLRLHPAVRLRFR